MISVICPTYGRPALLEEALESYLRQNDSNSELVIVNDQPGVTLLFDHPQVRVINHPVRFESLGEKRNFAVAASRGDIIVPLDDDDLFLPGYLTHCRSQLERVSGLMWYVPFNTLLYNRDEERLKLTPAMLPNLLVFRRSAWDMCQFPPVSFDENGLFLKSIVRAGCKGLQRRLPLKEMLYLVGWHPSMTSTYHTQKLYRANPHGFYQDISDWVEGHVDTGTIRLSPHWSHDYEAMRDEFIARPDVEKAAAVQTAAAKPEESSPREIRRRAWKAVERTWHRADSFVSAIRSRGVAATAVDVLGISKLGGRRVDVDTFNLRKASCFAPCEMLRERGGRHYCGACGCGSNSLAGLDDKDGRVDYDGQYTKLMYPDLECALGRPGFKNATPQPKAKS